MATLNAGPFLLNLLGNKELTIASSTYLWHYNRHNGRYKNVEKKTKLNSVALSESELYRPSERRILAKLVPNFMDRGCRVVRVTGPHDR
jgi:hypothetical protein